MGEEIADALKLSRGEVGALFQLAEALGERGGIAGGKEGGVIAKHLGDGTAACAERRDAAGHRLDEDVTELLFPAEFHAANGFAGEDEDIEAPKEIRDLRMRAGRENMQPRLLRGLITKPGLQRTGAEQREMKPADLFASPHELAEAFFLSEASTVADDESITRQAAGFTKGVSIRKRGRLMIFEIHTDLRCDEQTLAWDAEEPSSGLIACGDEIGCSGCGSINEAEKQALPSGPGDIFPSELAKDGMTLMKPGEDACLPADEGPRLVFDEHDIEAT